MADTLALYQPQPELALPAGLHSSSVAGHPGVQSSEDGSLLIKPALPVELDFYQSAASEPILEPLRPHIPQFLGTLKVEGHAREDPSGAITHFQPLKSGSDKYGPPDEFLENLAYPFAKPNVIDIKLGSILYDEYASPEKKERMIEKSRISTSFETGIRITGFALYDRNKAEFVKTDKTYGYSLKPSTLPEGFERCFPVESPSSIAEENDVGTALPADVLYPILLALREDITDILEVMKEIEIRMIGASLLIIYEADIDRAEQGLIRLFSEPDENVDLNEDDNEDEENEEGPSKPVPYTAKLIDFGHTRLAPGKGPDTGVIQGLETVLNLLEGRISSVERLLSDDSNVKN